MRARVIQAPISSIFDTAVYRHKKLRYTLDKTFTEFCLGTEVQYGTSFIKFLYQTTLLLEKYATH